MYINDAKKIFLSAVKAVQPQQLLPKYVYAKGGNLYLIDQKIKLAGLNKCIVIAAGKAAPAMAKATENKIGKSITCGYCITKYRHSIPLKFFRTIETAHPVPDKNSIKAGKYVLKELQNLDEKDIVLVLLSGGASSLLAIPEGSSLTEIQEVFDLLIKSGAAIHEINIVRKHLSRIKGGFLAETAYPARVFTLVISDVVGDKLESIASGPTVPDTSTFADACYILKKYNIWNKVALSVRKYIQKGVKKQICDTPKPGSKIFANTFTKIIGNNKIALDAAKSKAEQLGYHTIILNDKLTGDTEVHAKRFIEYLLNYEDKIPACIIMGGETTLKVNGSGKGGRNQHFVLRALTEFVKNIKNRDRPYVTILSAGTDGTDGPTDAAGAVFDSGLLSSLVLNQRLPEKYLAEFNSYNYFNESNGLVITGPTQTNVMDIVVGLIN